MSAARMAVLVALSLAAQPAAADKARERGGSSGGSRSSSAASRHPSSSSDHGKAVPRGSSSSSSLTDAERRHPRAGTGHGSRGVVFFGRPFHRYHPYYPYSPYYDYYGYYGYGYSGGYYPYYGGYRGYEYGSVRVLVDPEDTRVYVDGYYAGVADDFDGIFQRLHVAPGRHDVALKLEGFRTHRFRIYVPYGHTVKIHHDMLKGEGEDALEDLAGEEGAYEEDRAESRREDRYGRDEPSRDRSRDRGEAASPAADEDGTLRLEVRPDDASVYVDGEFRGAARDARRLELPPGVHRIEIVRPGYRTFDREVEVRPGESRSLDVELPRL